MIEVTEEMVRAFMRGYADADDGSSDVILNDKAEKAGLAAALAVIGRDYRLTPLCSEQLVPGIRCEFLSGMAHPAGHMGRAPSGSEVRWS